MKNICAWCRALISDNGVNDSKHDSHGMCESCQAWMSMSSANQTLSQLLDRLPVPTLVVDHDCRALKANPRAQEIFGKTPDLLEGELLGSVVECAYARLPEGCGGSSHCLACSIRKAVLETYETGSPVNTSTLKEILTVGDTSKQVRFSVATHKLDDAVVLRIDKV